MLAPVLNHSSIPPASISSRSSFGTMATPKGQHLQPSSSNSSNGTARPSSALEVTDLTLEKLETITNKFSEEHKVGSGGYGEVYRGVYNGCEIAVKKLYIINGLDDKDFTNEFHQLMKVRHENVIQLIAYCHAIKNIHTEINGQLVFSSVVDRALCFEYMQEGSLANHISDDSCIHDWATTYKIITGTCEGLHYLHKGRGEGDYIYHLDLKPDNILLDKDMTPKITDFGLSRLFGTSKTYKTCSLMQGTLGFMPPEYIHNGLMTPKNDVFSLGVIIFYLVAGRIRYGDYCDSRSSSKEFIERVQEYWKKKMRAAVPYYTCEEVDLLGVKTCIELAMKCVLTERGDRPSTKEIIDELQNLDAQIEIMSKMDSVSLSGQGNPYCTHIALDPSMELRFPFKPKMDLACCLQITNVVDCFIAFNIKTNKKKYHAQPINGIIPPFSKSYVMVTLRAQDKAPPNMQCLDKFIVESSRVSEDFTSQKITDDFHKKATTVILPIAYVEWE